MNTLPLPAIIERLCELSGCSSAMAQSFLSEFSELVSRALTDRGSIVVHGLGTFRAIEMGGVKSVEFAPDQSLANAVNAPFAMFEPVELDDAVTGDMLAAAAIGPVEPETGYSSDNEVATYPKEKTEPEPASHNLDNDEAEIQSAPAIDDSETEKNVDTEPDPRPEPEPESESEPIQPIEDKQEPNPQKHKPVPPAIPRRKTPAIENANQSAPEVKPAQMPVPHEKIIEKERVVEVVDRSHNLLHHLLTGLVALITGIAIGYFAYDKINLTGVKNVSISADDVQVYHQVKQSGSAESQRVEQAEASPAAETAAVESEPATDSESPVATAATSAPEKGEHIVKTKIVTDTVKSNRFLTTMAQQYYGKKKFWVYIYLENSDKLTDPDKIAANTVVVIPPAGKYDIKPGDPKSEEAAEQLAAKILNR